MRRIEFRGKRIDTDSWIVGNLVLPTLATTDTFIITWNGERHKVHLESVGQLIEHSFYNEEDESKSRKYIYEGDILLTCTKEDLAEYDYDDGKPDFMAPYRVAIKRTEAVLLDKRGQVVEQWSDGEIDSHGLHLSGCGYEEVIGNYFDNPELMEKK